MKTAAIALSSLIIIPSCSLQYAREENPESANPEFTFNNARFFRVEKNRTTMEMSAAKIEQYKTDSMSFAKDAEFRTYKDDGALETSGRCDLISADTGNERYMMFGNITVDVKSQEMTIQAESLNFDQKNEQITGGAQMPVRVTKNGTEIEGTGFSASGVSKTFSFSSAVSGTIETDDENGEETEKSDGK
ncbi:LPS export ABC transporter periplasmic protein LptC [Treponema saccharophilum]|uniref:OstA family protein n=1 Tax=Treponema saccharophilum DSM 2985 TaxID=907348 RepID=H7EHL5_9SPIR|nr:LPS export ABC transporter periplasmic protein LptC [Treponema saccharophilum]EIC02961.1 protein of unknown function DUF1239 [Treponema saccharophilum DSM 2985]BDC95449.1 hypothetical protein TRSA_05480 [Treponema saccharophilum]